MIRSPLLHIRAFCFRTALPGLLLGVLCWVGCGRKAPPAGTVSREITNSPPPVTLVRPAVETKPVAPRLEQTPVKQPPINPGLHVLVQLPADTNPPPLGVYAPAGRLVKGVMVNAIHSASIDTPLIALVAEDVWHDGELVLPAGTEMHGRAALGRARDRIVSSGPWTLVLQSGEELTVQGIALDREDAVLSTGTLDADGVAGIKGRVIRSDSAAEIKLFAATLFSGAAGALQQQRNTLLGSELIPNARNAALGGVGAVLNQYAQEISEAIKRDGTFVYVPAGKTIYLYITHTLDRSQAKVGNLRVGRVQPAELIHRTPDKP